MVDKEKTEVKEVEIKEKEPDVKEKEIKNLGILKVNDKLFVSSLPSETQSIIVKPDDAGIRLSAVIAPQKFRIRISDEDEYEGTRKIVPCKIKTPTLLMSIKYADNPVYGQVHVSGGIRLFAINPKVTDKIMVKPYRLSNVHIEGEICWGELPVPCDLNSAYNTYWASLFTADLLRTEYDDEDDDYDSEEDYLSYVKKYHAKILKHQKFRNMTDFICGKKYWAAPKGADAILISSNKYLLKQIPEQYWFRNGGDLPRIITLVNLIEDHWIFESKTFKFSILKDFVTFQSKFNKKLSDAKKKYAKLGINS